MKLTKAPYLDAVQGSSEKRSEVYTEYSERLSELLTQQRTKSLDRATSSASQQVEAIRGFA